MKFLNKNHTAISTVLAFALIPLSGFATDIYLPSFPGMAKLFGTSEGDIQLTLVVFVVSSGIGQLVAGSFVDRFGRYKLSLAALVIFSISSFIIALSHSITVVLAMRVVQGLTVALVVVSKRAFFMDVHSGDKLKHYTSLFSIIWATAPIAAPFIGGLLHEYFGWRSNFYFLGSATLVLILLEFRYSGETLKQITAFDYKSLLQAYREKLNTTDFAISLAIVGLCFSNVMTYNMASPFIIEQVFHQSAVTTGNSSLLSGLAILFGGLLSKATLHKTIATKMALAGPLLLLLPLAMIGAMAYEPSLGLMMAFVLPLHLTSGFTFNTFYAHALSRFSTNAGIVSGLVGGGTFIITSLVTFIMTTLLTIETPVALAIAYLLIEITIIAALVAFVLVRGRAMTTSTSNVLVTQVATEAI